MATQRFSELPHDERMAKRAALEAAGANVDGYADFGVYVSIKSGCFCAVDAAARAAGLVMKPDSLYHFPLATGLDPTVWGHDGRYHGTRGMGLHATYELPTTTAR